MVYKIKTNINDENMVKFLNTIENEQKRNDSFEIKEIMQIIKEMNLKCGVHPLLVLAPTNTDMLQVMKVIR